MDSGDIDYDDIDYDDYILLSDITAVSLYDLINEMAGDAKFPFKKSESKNEK